MGKTKKRKSPHTIKGVLEANNKRILKRSSILLIIVGVNLAFLWVCAASAGAYSSYQKASVTYLMDVMNWCYAAEDYMSGEKDSFGYETGYPAECRDQFYETVKSKLYGRISDVIEANFEIIDRASAGMDKVLSLYADGDEDAANDLYDSDVWPAMQEFQINVNNMVSVYSDMVRENNMFIISIVVLSILEGIVMTFVMFIGARIDSHKTSADIASPIETVSVLAKKMAEGSTDTGEIDDINEDTIKLDEAREMLHSFHTMAKSIAQHVDVVRRVADGDMTAFVNIRSDEDALGKNLYKMVQNNDQMFANVANVAEGVSEQIGYIATANTTLAESCTRQAHIVSEFIKKIDGVSDTITETANKADDSLETAGRVKKEVADSVQKMDDLKVAMEDIKNFSEKISAVITDIENIASETNLLSLNASIEAARAGEAGRGFAVVATSIGNLASQSAELSQQSKKLIEDTVACTAKGSEIATETFETFESVNKDINEILNAVEDIARRSASQHEYMESLKGGADQISETVEQNAALSQETASMSDEITNSSDRLKNSINRFNLRQRVAGQPYIPPEKEEDEKFIAEATENYKKFLEEHPFGNGYDF